MFKAPFSFSGRIRRTEYALSFIIYWIVLISIASIVKSYAILIPVYIVGLWFLWAQGAKRCHDRGNSGFYQIIPFYGLWMLFAEGEYDSNEYGDNPKQTVAIELNGNVEDSNPIL